jgi:hypothetical protein
MRKNCKYKEENEMNKTAYIRLSHEEASDPGPTG